MKDDKVYKFSKCTDSYLMYKKKIPNFLFWIVIVVFIVITGIIIWSAFVIKPYVVKSQGIVTVEDKSLITVSANANIEEINIWEGKRVKKGDILIVQEATEINAQVYQINAYIDYYNSRLELFDRLILYAQNDYSIDEENNCFDNSLLEELEFYNYMYTYISTFESYSGNIEMQETYKKQQINNYLIERNSLKEELIQYEAQKKVYELTKENYVIKAQSSGIVHLDTYLNKGAFLQAGSFIGSIVNDESDFIIECYLTAADRPKITVGDKVNVAISGLPKNEFGIITGKLIFIDTDATYSDGNNYIKAIVMLDEQIIKSDKVEVKLSFGMQAESRITYDEISYLNYFLGQLGIDVK